MSYDPHEYLAEDLIRLMLSHYDLLALMHLRVRGIGVVVVDLVEEILQIAEQKFYLPEQFYRDFRQVKEQELLEEMICQWARRKEHAKRIYLY